MERNIQLNEHKKQQPKSTHIEESG